MPLVRRGIARILERIGNRSECGLGPARPDFLVRRGPVSPPLLAAPVHILQYLSSDRCSLQSVPFPCDVGPESLLDHPRCLGEYDVDDEIFLVQVLTDRSDMTVAEGLELVLPLGLPHELRVRLWMCSSLPRV